MKKTIAILLVLVSLCSFAFAKGAAEAAAKVETAVEELVA